MHTIKRIYSHPQGFAQCVKLIENYKWEKITDFIPCVAWNNQAEFISNYVKKGNLLEVTGLIQSRTYQTQSGENRTVIEVVIDSVSNLTPKPKEETTPQFEPQYKNILDDDLPF